MATYNQLSYGSRGSDVTELQKLLNKNGYKLSEDGIFGTNTQAAVKDYQQKNNLAVDGIVGNNTWGALSKASTSTTANQNTTTASTGYQYSPYQESDVVKQAQAMIQQQLPQKPGEYQSQWQPQINDIVGQILNREKFSYDLNADALYNQLKEQYVLQGQQAKMDTMGQAQAMTGGYGNSYAQSVGQQAYQGYLQQLNDRIPDLYQMALSKYQMEGDALNDQFAILGTQEDRDYGRYQDQLNQYYTDLDQAYNRYDTERDYDYGKWADGRDFQYQQDRDKVSDDQWQKEYDFALRQYNDSQKSSSGSTKKKTSSTPTATPTPQPEPEPTGDKLTYSDVALTAAQMRKQGASPNDIYQYISSVVNGPNYTPTNSAKQDLSELKSGYVGNGR